MVAALSRRRFLGASAGALALAGAGLGARQARAAAPGLHVMKDPNCGCCAAWVDIMARQGFEISVEEMPNGRLIRRKIELGVPRDAVSCHTGLIAGYVVEGHVPAADIRRLLTEAPDAVGVAVPGMPWGSPGMGPQDAREAFDTLLIGRDGRLTVWSRYDAA